jgi:hypothetical protein
MKSEPGSVVNGTVPIRIDENSVHSSVPDVRRAAVKPAAILDEVALASIKPERQRQFPNQLQEGRQDTGDGFSEPG